MAQQTDETETANILRYKEVEILKETEEKEKDKLKSLYIYNLVPNILTLPLQQIEMKLLMIQSNPFM